MAMPPYSVLRTDFAPASSGRAVAIGPHDSVTCRLDEMWHALNWYRTSAEETRHTRAYLRLQDPRSIRVLSPYRGREMYDETHALKHLTSAANYAIAEYDQVKVTVVEMVVR